MAFKLENVVPWGRSLADYRGMFNLTETDLQQSILDCASGPSSFNVEMTRAGGTVISCDPIYQFSVAEIRQRIEKTYPSIIQGLQVNRDRFVWQEIQSPAQLGEMRMAAMEQFLADLSPGLAAGRYRVEELPQLPFEGNRFDLALCGHFLFSYSDQFSLEFHLASILELCRVAREVRVFPLLENFTGDRSPHLEPIERSLRERGYQCEIAIAAYEFQRNGNQLLRVREQG